MHSFVAESIELSSPFSILVLLVGFARKGEGNIALCTQSLSHTTCTRSSYSTQEDSPIPERYLEDTCYYSHVTPVYHHH